MNDIFVCKVAISPLRHEASDKAEMVSQLLFGDSVQVLEKTEKWYLIKTLHDDYQAWVDPKHLQAHSFENESLFMTPLQPVNELIAANGSKYYLPAGSSLPLANQESCQIGDQLFKFGFKPVCAEPAQFSNKIEATARFFLNAPYLWGGRTLFGIDCSGFSQIVYKLLGYAIRRDASQQAEQGTLVDFVSAAQTGDLAFFDNEEGKITHVGIMLENDQIIHASGKVRIDAIDNQGIYNTETNRYTHQLRIIKRLV